MKSKFELYMETGIDCMYPTYWPPENIHKYIKRGSKKQEVNHYR